MAQAPENTTLTIERIANELQAEICGPVERTVTGVAIVEQASANELTYIGTPKQINRLQKSAACCVIVPRNAVDQLPQDGNHSYLLVDEPEVAFLKVAEMFCPRRIKPAPVISSSATIASSARIGNQTAIGHSAVIEDDVVIGDNCTIGPGVVVSAGCQIGNNVTIHANTVLYEDVIIGNDVIIHATCVIGADGFGYRTVNGRHEHLPHFGIVRICDDVEIGAGTTIDRAKVGETVIGSGTRIDNQVMIGHNCVIGKHNLIVSQVGFAGSVTTGDYVVCAGQVGIADHVHLGDGAMIGAKAGVHRDMPGGQAYLGAPASPAADATRQLMALKRLPELRSTVKRLQKEVSAIKEEQSIPDAA